jgi:hypothetical protein
MKLGLLNYAVIPINNSYINFNNNKINSSLTYCDILGFPGNATMKRTCPHNNEADASRQQSKQKAVTMDMV